MVTNENGTMNLLGGYFSTNKSNLSKKIELTFYWLDIRGGIEDTRLEPKAKDKKKSEAKDSLSEDRHSQGQGQECSKPRTKDTSASTLQNKKKGLHKKFSGDLQKKKKRPSQKFLKRSPQKTFSKKIFRRSTKF